MKPFRITNLWAYCATEPGGDEGVAAALIGGMMMPLIAADAMRVKDLRPYADEVAKRTGARIVLRCFENGREVEVISEGLST